MCASAPRHAERAFGPRASLLDFLEDDGVILANHHTPLISHTADDIITALTGVYGSRHGQPVANSYGVFDPSDPTNSTVDFPASFIYWTGKAPDGMPRPSGITKANHTKAISVSGP
jgi:hypothetical protein